ncbi:uncharacterized protein LOC134531938 isoform X4 [Bacillus rossius redtenbacheri]|uniref:uncharacterized protein LOC134531938 isoform X4 n=1 Tax=Bacillus rossius redtenbacheri TaxID=93214 RepID=UPI002FDDEC53
MAGVSLADVLRLGRDLGVKLEPEEVEEEEGNVGTEDDARTETAEWFQSLAAQATVLAVEHEKMAEMLGLQRQFDLQESRLRSELESCRRDRLTTRRWRDQLLRDKLAEVEAATSEMKQLVSQLDEASPCWRNKVRFAEMF